MEDYYGTTKTWVKGKRVLLENVVSVPQEVKEDIIVKIGIWEPEEETVLSIDGSSERHLTLEHIKL